MYFVIPGLILEPICRANKCLSCSPISFGTTKLYSYILPFSWYLKAMMHENILIRMQWASLFYRRVFSTQNMSVDGGYDIRIILEGGEQFFLEYLSPGWVEFTLFLLSFPIPGEGVEGQTFRLRLARRTLQRAFKRTSPPDFLS